MDTKSEGRSDKKFFNNALLVLIFLLICRLIANYFIPLNDATEARYGEIARKMLETGNWVNLLHDYGVPFWAKPPLSTWCSAISMNWFGINEFAVRLPSLVFSIIILILTWFFAKKHSGSNMAMVSVLVLAGTLFFFLAAGTVMTDVSLVFCTTLATIAFWHALVNKHQLWAYVFFVSLGLGLLAKGPLALVLVGIPVFFWVLLRNEWSNLWHSLPWIKGSALLILIALPWYILAEMRTPGFLNYFIVGEHLNRFLVPGWTGDKYGTAHYAPKGMIWIFAVGGMFPWSLVVGKWLVTEGRKLPSLFHDQDGWLTYLALCTVTPLLFFTFASNIIYPYVFPSLPAFALFFAEIWNRSNPSLFRSRWIGPCAMLSGIFFLVVTFLFVIKPELVEKTQKPVVEAWLDNQPKSGSSLVYWADKTDFSAQFYSAGRVKSTQSVAGLCKLFSKNSKNYLVINAKLMNQIPQKIVSQFILLKTIQYKNEQMLLLQSPVLSCQELGNNKKIT